MLCVLLDPRVKWDYRVSQLDHICFSEESHNMAPIYNIIHSVPFLLNRNQYVFLLAGKDTDYFIRFSVLYLFTVVCR